MSMNNDVVFTCSIDDGHPSDMKAVEILARHGLNATFFVPVRNREGMPVMANADLRDIASRFEIGSHTYDHCYLNRLDFPVAQYQVIEGRKRLEDVLGRPVPGFCYPGGKYTRHHARMLRQAGFAYARTTTNLCFESGHRRFEMPTTIQFYPHARSVLLRNFVRGGRWHRRQAGLRLALQSEDWIVRLYALFNHAREHGGIFHLWGHAKDIDELNAWPQFNQFLAHVAQRVAPKNRLNNQQLALRAFPRG